MAPTPLLALEHRCEVDAIERLNWGNESSSQQLKPTGRRDNSRDDPPPARLERLQPGRLAAGTPLLGQAHFAWRESALR
jgi:hypothetical protein